MPFEKTHTRMMEFVGTKARIGWNITTYSTRGFYGLTMNGKIGSRDFEIHLTQNQDSVFLVEVFGVKINKLTQFVDLVPIFTEPSILGDDLTDALASMGKTVYDRIREARRGRGQDNPDTPGALFLSH